MMNGLGIHVPTSIPDDRAVTSDETHDASVPSPRQVSSPVSRAEKGAHSTPVHLNGGLNKILASEVQRLINPKKVRNFIGPIVGLILSFK